MGTFLDDGLEKELCRYEMQRIEKKVETYSYKELD